MKMRSITRILAIALALVLAAGLAACGSNASKKSEYKGIKTDSPEWVANLDAAATADQMLIVAAFSETATDAWVSLHEKQADGTWKMVMTTPGFIGKNGLGKTKEGDAKTPTGVFHFNRAFGIADDPGCAIPYVKVDQDTYWSGDPREGFHYNELVNIKDLPDLDLASGDSEHIIDYIYHYQYCLNISYNEEGSRPRERRFRAHHRLHLSLPVLPEYQLQRGGNAGAWFCDLPALFWPCEALYRRLRSHSGGPHEICHAAR